MQTLSIKKDKEEPEHMRKWKEEQQEMLMKKDQEESAAMEELKVKAKQELEDWYKRYETQVEKTKSSNREEETKYEIGKDIYAGMQTLSIKKDKEEPEHMRKWKEEQQEMLMKKDQEESAAMEELKVKAKQ